MNRLAPADGFRPARRNAGADAAKFPQHGITLLESLIALVVITVGLLGIAAMQVIGVQESASALRHSQATWLAYEMADRMRANINPAALNPNDVSAGPTDIADHYDGIEVSATKGASTQVCGLGNTCSLQQMAAFDANQWRLSIMDLPNGSGTVDEDTAAGGRYRIRVMWDDARAGGIAAETGCPSRQDIGFACVEAWVQP